MRLFLPSGIVSGLNLGHIQNQVGRVAYGVRLRPDSEARELGWMRRELRHFNSADVLVVARIVSVADDAIGHAAHLILDMAQIRPETIPLGRKSRIALGVVSWPSPKMSSAPL